jgi:hypothetical protein
MIFGKFTVCVIDKNDGKLYKYNKDNLMAATGLSNLYNATGHQSWVDRNLRQPLNEEKVKNDYKKLKKILKDEEKMVMLKLTHFWMMLMKKLSGMMNERNMLETLGR